MSNIKVFENKKVRTIWNPEREDWFFSVVDVCEVLTGSESPRKYWNKLKQRLKVEGSELVTNCHQLKMQAADGKMRLTDTLDTKGVLRLVQSIPSPNAEPFKNVAGSKKFEDIVKQAEYASGLRQTTKYYLLVHGLP